MYIVPIAWLYVALMMAVAEATNSNGTVLGAVITFLVYGLAPVALVMYLMGSPSRRRAIKAQEAAELAERRSAKPDTGGKPPSDAITPVGKEP